MDVCGAGQRARAFAACGRPRRRDHYAIFMENHVRYVETCGAGERAGLYYTHQFVSYRRRSRLHRQQQRIEAADHLAGQARGRPRRAGAMPQRHTLPHRGRSRRRTGDPQPRRGHRMLPRHPDPGRIAGRRRCCIPPAPPAGPRASCGRCPNSIPASHCRRTQFLQQLWRFRDGETYLSPAPLYHAAPHGGVNLTIRMGGTAVIMERFDPEDFLRLVQTTG